MKNILILISCLIFTGTMLSAEGTKLPPIKLKDMNKKKVDLSKYYEKGPIVINFWTLACEPCKKEMKHLSALNTKYKDNNFQVVSINMDTPRSISKVKSYVKSQKFSFDVLSDPKSAVFRKLGGKVMPYVIMVNSDGEIVKRHIGYNPGDEIELEKEIIELLGLKEELKTEGEVPEELPYGDEENEIKSDER